MMEEVLMLIDLEMVISGFVSKVVNDCGDILKKRIKDADKNRKSGVQNIETRIYQVTIDALNEFTKDTYKEQDALYDTAENILKGFKSCKDDNVEAVRTGLKMLVSQVTSDTCKDFLGTLCHEICTDENGILYKEIVLIQQEKTNENITEGFRNNTRNHEKAQEKLNEIQISINDLKEKQDIKGNHELENSNKIPIKNRAEEYAQKWNKNVFLNDFNEEDENAGVNIKLRDIYKEICLPHYIWKTNTKPSNKLRNLLTKYLIDNNGRKMLLILGQAGIGKSTLITWIMANLVEKKDNIYVYQFASDLKKINWLGDDILSEILKTLRLRYGELENKTLILDGFDELYVKGNRERILVKLNQELKGDGHLQKLFLIITCRENYVHQSHLKDIEYITLQAWNEDQIKSFCEIYGKESTRKNSERKINKIIEKKEIFGIPLVLYMVLALNINVEENSSTVDIYDQVFSLEEGGIYDRYYDREHRTNLPDIKGYIHRISQRIAFWIFENNADEAFIPQKKFQEICNNEAYELKKKGEDIQSDTLIGNFFKLKHYEGIKADELQFVHRSIYEYFFVLYFFETIHNLTSKERTAGKLGKLLKDGYLSEQILEFIKCKFDKMKRYNWPDFMKKVFNIMLRDGMIYHVGIPCKNAIRRERNIFSNMLKVVGLWNLDLGNLNDNISIYLQCNKEDALNLRGIRLVDENSDIENLVIKYESRIDLEGVYLSKASLNKAILRGVNLSRADLRGADLREADLRGADLSKADLREANLSKANLRGADLRKADLRGADLREADLSKTNLRKTYLNEANLSKADLEEADLSEASLIEVNLKRTYLNRVGLRRADLRGSYLSGADLSEADLSGVDLRGSYLSGADLSGADLSGADLSGADLRETYLGEVHLSGVIFDEDQVNSLCKKYDLIDSRVYISETDEVISYRKYCIRKLRT